ncbi:PDZ and LIM domain protein Zasp isoform X2 [Contarinia nasturtii]|uniref:PDZ and LIM domain protein Zasp isoform X2 n=1 Tax=Contarinia nasturtii TaxID=265458 RepID=UPI0012D4867B|nr:PDZ and LIM domain protein Zasp isoform X2 [Contarinia nasturtii]
MAQLINVRLNRVDAQPWGLRLQGGKDFGTPLVVQKVNHGSIADQAGLQPGDAVIAVNNMEAFNLRHKDAQDLIVRSGNTFDLTIQRGGSTWKPHVSPTGSMPSPGQQNYGGPVTKTSLQHHPPPQEPHIGCGYNNSARPFSQNGSVKSIVNKQYNTPVGMYSEESIAETLTAQAEVLANGVLGVNFKKNEKAYNSEGSEVLKALKESENDPPEPASSHFYWTASHAIGNYSAVSSRTNTPNPYSAQQQQFQQQQQQQPSPQPICRKEDFAASETVQRPILPSTTIDTTKTPTVQTKIVDSSTQCIVADTTSSRASPPCDACGATIVGVFVRIKDKNLHVDCFKCATCGTSLKNQGYFNINNKLYCDVHAKLAAVQNPPTGTEGYRPGLIQPNSKLNANSTISNALSSHANGGHDFTIMPTHSRTSSSASSVGSSYVSSTDSNKTSHIESPTPIQSQLLENVNNSNNFHTLNGTQTLPSYQNAYKLINEHLHNHKNGNSNGNGNGNINGNGHSNNNEQEYHDDCSDNDQIDFNDLHHESSITCNKLSMIDQTVNETNGKSNDSIYGTIKQFNNEQMIGGEHFAYKTLNGDVIRSVQPPGKGKPINYKIKSNLGGPRPFGVPTAGPRSPAMNQSWSQPIPAQTSFVNNYGSQTLPRSTVGQNAPAVSQTTNGLAETPTAHLDINANKKPMENSLDDTTTNDYEPGQATEMLTNSVLNLKIESDTKENFKAHAGKILTGMLESRLNNEKNLQNSQAHKIMSTLNKSIINENNNKYSHDTNGNSTTYNGKPAFQSFNSIAAQKLCPNLDTVNNLNNNSNNTVAMPLIIPTSPITAANAADFPPPPSPSELNEHKLDFHNENHKQSMSLIGQTNLNDHDSVDNDVYSSIQPIDGFSAKTNPIQYQQQQHHHHQHQTHGHHQVNNQQHYDNDHSNSVVFRNKNTKPELTTHARDRRSYIEKDNFNQNRYLNHNNNLITSQATEIATGLKDGKHPVCSVCHIKITRGPFITALGRIWCPEHFVCVNGSCRRPLQDIGFVEEKGDLYCEYCFEQFLAPPCDKCSGKIKGDCLNAIGKHFHPECFTCTYCGKLFGNSPFFLEDGRPYCESDWNELFTTKCFACGFPVEAGDRWVEALSHNYHSQCFNCTMCKKNLEGQSFYAKAGRPYCKNHAR